MTRRALAGIACVAVAASLVLAPDGACDDRRRRDRDRDRGESRRLPVVPPGQFAPPHRGLIPFGPPFFGPAVRGVIVVPSPPLYPPPVYVRPYPYDDPWAYAVPPIYAPPGGSVSVAPSTPDIVEYPEGRYELRGDGIVTPYRWVWIPNPPPGPPPAAPPAPGPASQAPLYRWTDERGAVHWTDRWDAIPEGYRSQAKEISR